jgi:probable phosphoglycerate mutase
MTWTLTHLVRHGSTAWTEQGLVQGQTDLPLSPRGLQEAQKAAALLAASVGPGCRVVASDLRRARQTADEIAVRFCLMEVETFVELRERVMGAAEGRAWSDLPPGYDFSDAEPEAAFVRRVLVGLRRVAEQGGEAVVVTHAGVIGAVLDAMGLPPRHVVPGELAATVAADSVGRVRLVERDWPPRVAAGATL